MKKIYSLYVLVTIFFVACTPQVTVTSEVTVTLSPASPTPEATSTPEPTTTPIAETVTMGNVIFNVDENGVMTIKEATGVDEKTKAENRAKVDPEVWGCEDCKVIKIDDKIVITPAGDPETHIAFWNGTDWKWQWDELDNLPGGNFIFDIAKLWEMDGSNVVDPEGVKKDSEKIYQFSGSDSATTSKKGNSNWAIYVFSEDEKKTVGASLNTTYPYKSMSSQAASSGDVDGVIYFLNRDNILVKMVVDGLKFKLRSR